MAAVVGRNFLKCECCRRDKQPCEPRNRIWNEQQQQKCDRCERKGGERFCCGPNVAAPPTLKRRRGDDSDDDGQPESSTAARRIPRTGTTPVARIGGNHGNKGESQSADLLLAQKKDTSWMKLLFFLQYLQYFCIRAPDNVLLTVQRKILVDNLQFSFRSAIETLRPNEPWAAQYLQRCDTMMRRFHELAGDLAHLLPLLREDLRMKTLRLPLNLYGSLEGASSTYRRYSRQDSMYERQLQGQDIAYQRRLTADVGEPYSSDTASTPASGRSSPSIPNSRFSNSFLAYSADLSMDLIDGCDSKDGGLLSTVLSQVQHTRRYTQRSLTRFCPAAFRAFLFGTEADARSWVDNLGESLAAEIDLHKRKIVHIAAECGRIYLLGPTLHIYQKDYDKFDDFATSPLATTVLRGDLRSTQLLVEAGYRTNCRDNFGSCLLGIACRSGHLEIVNYLVDVVGMPVNATGQVLAPPLYNAFLGDNQEICCFLIRKGVNLDVQIMWGVQLILTDVKKIAEEKEMATVVKLITTKRSEQEQRFHPCAPNMSGPGTPGSHMPKPNEIGPAGEVSDFNPHQNSFFHLHGWPATAPPATPNQAALVLNRQFFGNPEKTPPGGFFDGLDFNTGPMGFPGGPAT